MGETIATVPPTILEQGVFAGYKEQILDRVRQTAHGIEVMDACTRWGLVRPDQPELRQSDSSFSRHEVITLGIRPAHEEGASPRLFEPEQFSFLDEHAYSYLHEAWHRLYPIVLGRMPDIQRWRGMSQKAREASSEGLTILGSSEYYAYNPASVRAEEDMVELLAMASYDPAYTDRFIAKLTDPSSEGKRYRFTHRLVSLSKKKGGDLAYALQKGIENITMYPHLTPMDEEAYRAHQYLPAA